MTLSHTSHNIIITQYKSSFIMKIEMQKNVCMRSRVKRVVKFCRRRNN